MIRNPCFVGICARKQRNDHEIMIKINNNTLNQHTPSNQPQDLSLFLICFEILRTVGDNSRVA